MGGQKAIVVGISGCSSSGKTTLARLLRDIFPNTFILHEDDFYRPEEELPFKNGVRDWDCAESINIPDMEKALSHIRTEGTFPVSITKSGGPNKTHRSSHGVVSPRPNFLKSPHRQENHPAYQTARLPLPPSQPFVDSKEDKNSVGQCPASDAKIEALKAKVQAWLQPGSPGHDVFSGDHSPRMCLLDGFLLYSPPKFSKIMDTIDVKLFLQVSHAKATQRREARDGYVTLEGFWKDPPGYVDKVVWPNYVEAHRWMFVGGDFEAGKLDLSALNEKGISAQLGKVDADFEETLEWAVDSVMEALEKWHAQR
ncbi:Nicotinamide riboside kinase [Cytospora mali]|uniref:Nicotinamide riboside kinase n=1 Tax=Cytospora mali TaxID=578113 RepID=A0A194VTH0_CYTMA|nr:Nicotinamide riboside kinase [Valsa mali]